MERRLRKAGAPVLYINETQGKIAHPPPPSSIQLLCCEAMAMSLGTYFALVVNEDGNVHVFGANRVGQLGTSDVLQRDVPTLLDKDVVYDRQEVVMVSAGGIHGACVTAWTWGSNL